MPENNMKIQILLFCSTIFLSSCSSVPKSADPKLSKFEASTNNSDFEPNKKFEYGETLLHKEAHAKFQKPNLKAMQQLIQRGADVNAVDDFGNTPLHVCRDLNAAKLLVKNGANLEALNKQGLNPLDTICNEAARLSVFEFDDVDWLVDIVEFLLLQGAMFSENFKLEVFECKRLLLLVLKNGGALNLLQDKKLKLHGIRNPKMIKFLCDSGWAYIDDRGKEFKTALHVAIEEGWAESVKTLLECGADIRVKFKNSPDQTALDIKPKANQEEIRALLQKAANNPIKCGHVKTISMPICSIAELKQKMKNPNFDINKQYAWVIDVSDYTYSSEPGKYMSQQRLVNIAAIQNDLPYLKFLIKNGAYFKPRKNEHDGGLGSNELHPLILTTSPEFAEYLLQKGVHIDETNNGSTLLIDLFTVNE
jgi:ankyrin repeat protein